MINTVFVQVVLLVAALFFLVACVGERRFKDKVLYFLIAAFMTCVLMYSMRV